MKKQINAVTKQAYQGKNFETLALRGYTDNRWCTYVQARANGWNVRKGEKGTHV